MTPSRAFMLMGARVSFDGQHVSQVTSVAITVNGLKLTAHYDPADPAQRSAVEMFQKRGIACLEVILPSARGWLRVIGKVTGEVHMPCNDAATLTLEVEGLVTQGEGEKSS